jgi:DNA-binding NtrC family response regulator
MLSLRIAEQTKVQPRTLSSAALVKLSGYSFPGNIRELRNLLERALILGRGSELEPDDFPVEMNRAMSAAAGAVWSLEQVVDHLPLQLNLRDTLTDIERLLIGRALMCANGVQAEAARQLELSRSDIGYKVAKYGMSSIPRASGATPGSWTMGEAEASSSQKIRS